tara:strand:+ start:2829 stop:4169 length:1341 start_codon:yes stop_codon:yes gene_type:complete
MSIPMLGAIIFIGTIAGIMYLIGLTKKWGILLPFAGMVFFSSLAMPLSWNDQVNPTVWLPIQRIRSSLFFGSGIAATLIVLFQLQRLKGKSISISAIMLIGVGLYASFLRYVHGGAEDGTFSVVFSVMTLFPLAMTAAMILDEVSDLRLIFRSIALTNIIWIGMVFVQIAVNPNYVTQGNEYRFVGLLSNPQHSGVLMAFFVVISLWLLLNDQKKYKIIMIGLTGVNGLFLLWTGSRTGLGMTLIGVSSVLYSRAGRAILLLPLAGILGFLSLKIMVNVVGIDLGFERMVSTENTRSAAWQELIMSASQNPLIGVGMDEIDRSENSWLYGYATYGIGMLLLLVITTIAAGIEILKAVRARFIMQPEYRPYLDIVLGILLMYLAGAVLEGYMISRVSMTTSMFMIASVGLLNIRKAAVHQIEYASMYDEYQSEYGDEYADDYEEGYS